MIMKINKHGTFYIRNGWPTKILTSIRNNPCIFSPNSELNAVDELGVGRVMIKALRYWASTLGLVVEERDTRGLLCLETGLFREIYEHDLYFQNKGTLWLLQRELTTKEEYATAWYWLFNEHKQKTFTKDDFIKGFYSYVINHGGTYAQSAIEKEFDCVKNTYVSDSVYDINKIIDEDTIPFFAPLALIKNAGKGCFEKQRIKAIDMPLDIFYFALFMDNAEHLVNNCQVAIDTLVEQPKQVCKYFNMSYSTLIELLQMLENQGRIKLFNNFGNRHIEMTGKNSEDILREFYQA